MNNWFISMATDGIFLYWITELDGLFMKMKLKDAAIEYMIDKDTNTTFQASSILCYYNSLLFYVIDRGEKIVKYDLKDNSTQVFYIGCEEMYLNMHSYVSVVKDSLIILPIYGKYLIYVNIKTGETKQYDLLENINVQKLQQCFALGVEPKGDEIKFISSITNEWLVFSLTERRIIRRESIPEPIGNVLYFEKYGEFFLLMNSDNELIKYKKNYTEKLMQFSKIQNDYQIFHVVNNDIWVMPLYGQDIYIYSLTDKKTRKYKNYPEEYKYNAIPQMGKFTNKCTINGKTYFAMHAGTSIFCIDNRSAEGYFIYSKWPNAKENIEQVYRRNMTLKEGTVDLSHFLEYVFDIGM